MTATYAEYHRRATCLVAGIMNKATRLMNAAMQEREPIFYRGSKFGINTKQRADARKKR